jgi:putative resolvase
MTDDAYMPSKLVSTSIAAKALGVSGNTLRTWANNKLIDFQLTPGGHRRFDTTTLRQAIEPADRRQNLQDYQIITKKQATKGAIYCRVSSGKQTDDLQRQIETTQEAYPGFSVYKDVASGLNYKRKGLQRLLGHCQEGVVDQVVVAHRDRLARFGVEIIEWIIDRSGASLVFLDQGNKSKRGSNEELAEDLLAVVHVFSCRANGKRRDKRPHKGGEDVPGGGVQEPKRRRMQDLETAARCNTSEEGHTLSPDQNHAVEHPARLAFEDVERHTHDIQPGIGTPTQEQRPQEVCC